MALTNLKVFGIIVLTFSFILTTASVNTSEDKSKEIVANDRKYDETKELDTTIIEFLTQHHYPGAVLGVADDKGIRYAQGYGTNQNGNILKSTSVLSISSISKLLTATAVMKLVENGSLSISDFVFGSRGILSQLQPFSSYHTVDRKLFTIKIYHLLHHTSGLQTDVSEVNNIRLRRGHSVPNITNEMNLNNSLTLEDAIRYTAGLPLQFAPGIKFSYSNLNYAILGEIIKKVSGMTYSNFVTREILLPLGMWKTTSRSSLMSLNNSKDSFSLDISNSPLLMASLGWHSSVFDILRLMKGLKSNSILTADSFEQMLSPPSPAVMTYQQSWYGMGLYTGNDGSWWQIGDPHTTEVLMYDSGYRVSNGLQQHLQWVVIFTANQHRNLRSDFSKLFGTVQSWPLINFSVMDCADNTLLTQCRNHQLINTNVSVDQFKSFANLLLAEKYRPTWIDIYYSAGRPRVSSIWQSSNSLENDNVLESALSSKELGSRVAYLGTQDKHLHLIIPYKIGEQLKYIAYFCKESTGYEQFGWETNQTVYDKSLKRFIEQLNLVPRAIATVSQHNKKIISFIFNKLNTSSWRMYDVVNIEKVKSLIKENARQDRTLNYVDTYDYLGQNHFSMIFAADKRSKGMHLEMELERSVILQHVEEMQTRRFRPTIISGYKSDNSVKFLILWLKHE